MNDTEYEGLHFPESGDWFDPCHTQPPTRLGARQCLLNPGCMGLGLGIQEKCRPGWRSSQGVWIGTGRVELLPYFIDYSMWCWASSCCGFPLLNCPKAEAKIRKWKVDAVLDNIYCRVLSNWWGACCSAWWNKWTKWKSSNTPRTHWIAFMPSMMSQLARRLLETMSGATYRWMPLHCICWSWQKWQHLVSQFSGQQSGSHTYYIIGYSVSFLNDYSFAVRNGCDCFVQQAYRLYIHWMKSHFCRTLFSTFRLLTEHQ